MSEVLIWPCLLDGFLVVKDETLFPIFHFSFITVDISLSRNYKSGLKPTLVGVLKILLSVFIFMQLEHFLMLLQG